MDSSWKRIIYLICTIQVGGGITIIGVVSFIPLFWLSWDFMIKDRRLCGQGLYLGLRL